MSVVGVFPSLALVFSAHSLLCGTYTAVEMGMAGYAPLVALAHFILTIICIRLQLAQRWG